MVHYQRNIRFLLFLVLPTLGFILGWTLNQKANESNTTIEQSTKSEENTSLVDIELPKIKKNIKPKDVDLDIFWEAWSEVENNFLYRENFDVQKQIYGATKGMVDSFGDAHTNFLSPEETKLFNESINGSFEGIGAEIGFKNERIVVIAPLKGAPAELAGLKSGDIIYEVDGTSTYGESLENVVRRIKGPKGEPVTLTIIREGEDKPLEIVIVRDHIILQDLTWEIKDGIAIVTISQFGIDTDKDFAEAINEILLESPTSIVIDLRNNGGGILDVAKNMLGEFLEYKTLTKIKGRKFIDSGELVSKSGGRLLDIPLAVIVNGGSASASEIFAGAIQDHARGVVIGTKTFGKGSVQNLLPLSDGASIKVTIAEWLTPEGRSINNNGILPDEIIESDDDFETDNIMEKTIEILNNDDLYQEVIERETKKPEDIETSETEE